MKKISILLLTLLWFPGAQAEETVYVSDHLVITLREGQGSQFKIIKTLITGTRLTVLDQTDTGYTQVRTADGIEGWVRTQYMSDQPSAHDQLTAAQSQLERNKEQIGKHKTEISTLRKNKSKLTNERKQLREDNQQLKTQLTRLNKIAAKPILLDRVNRDLQQQNVSLEKQLQMFTQENQILKDSSHKEWFIAGAVVLLGGFLLGLIIPKIRWKKKDKWNY